MYILKIMQLSIHDTVQDITLIDWYTKNIVGTMTVKASTFYYKNYGKIRAKIYATIYDKGKTYYAVNELCSNHYDYDTVLYSYCPDEERQTHMLLALTEYTRDELLVWVTVEHEAYVIMHIYPSYLCANKFDLALNIMS